MTTTYIAIMTVGVIFLTAVIAQNWYIKNRMCEEIKALNKMIDLAIQGKYEEKDFDESMRSLLESKLSKFIVQSQCHVRNTELEEKRVKTLISDISHQTKIPISNIVLYSELLLEMNLPTESTQYVNTITKQSKKIRLFD